MKKMAKFAIKILKKRKELRVIQRLSDRVGEYWCFDERFTLYRLEIGILYTLTHYYPNCFHYNIQDKPYKTK